MFKGMDLKQKSAIALLLAIYIVAEIVICASYGLASYDLLFSPGYIWKQEPIALIVPLMFILLTGGILMKIYDTVSLLNIERKEIEK